MIKRRSNKQSLTPGLLDYTFFTDRDLGEQFPKILLDAGLRVEKHDDHFSDITQDIVWLSEIGQKGWIALSHNKRMRKNSFEVSVLMESNVREFILIGHTKHSELAINFVNTRFKVLNFLNKYNEPFMAKIYRPAMKKRVKGGYVTMWYDHKQWLLDQNK